ncbi:MAG: ATP-dependent Clp protease adaptor ClpS [Myxococcota bacterium]
MTRLWRLRLFDQWCLLSANDSRFVPRAADGGDDEPIPWTPDSEGEVATESKKKLKRPKLYKVLLHNDDYTTMEFVVMVLVRIFHHSESEAMHIMLHVHNHGVGTAGIFTYEMAETKAQKTMEMAREHQYPLRTSVEPTQDGDEE